MVNSDPWAYGSSYDLNHLNLLNASANPPYTQYNSTSSSGNVPANPYTNYNILSQNDGGGSLLNAGLYSGNVRGSPSEYSINLNSDELQLNPREYHQPHLNLNDGKPMVNYMAHLSPDRYVDDGAIIHDKDLNRTTSIGGFNIGSALIEDEQAVKDDCSRVKVEYNMY